MTTLIKVADDLEKIKEAIYLFLSFREKVCQSLGHLIIVRLLIMFFQNFDFEPNQAVSLSIYAPIQAQK